MGAGIDVMSALQKRSQARLEEDQANIAADQQSLQVAQREADRKDRLASSLASQNALSGAKGISAFEGSPLTILQDSMKRAATGTERDRFSTELSTLAIRNSARMRRRLADAGNALTLTQQIEGKASAFMGGPAGG